MANVPPSPQYQRQNKREAMETGGFVMDFPITTPPADFGPNSVYEPSPLAAGTNGVCSSGGAVIIFNALLHVATCIVTCVAAGAHINTDKHLTKPLHNNDYIQSWCYVMIICEPIAVLIWVLWYGFVVRSFQTPWVATIGGTLFLAVFVCTLKLSYYLEISHGLAAAASVNMHASMNEGNKLDDFINWSSAAVYFQCVVLATSLYTPMSGIYYKVLQMEKKLATPM